MTLPVFTILLGFFGYAAVILLEQLHLTLLQIFAARPNNCIPIQRTDSHNKMIVRDGYYRVVLRFYPLYTAVVFIASGAVRAAYIAGESFEMDTIITGAVWMAICIILDTIGYFIRRPRPWHLEFDELHSLPYQRKLILAYLSIMVGAIIGALFLL